MTTLFELTQKETEALTEQEYNLALAETKIELASIQIANGNLDAAKELHAEAKRLIEKSK